MIDSEEISYQYIIKKIKQFGWQWSLGSRNQEGFDIKASKNKKTIKIEVKSRTIREYSPGGSLAQTTIDRRRFHFSDNQLESSDFFICVFVGPELTQAYVVPKNKFDILRQRTKEGNWLSFDPNRDFIIRGRKKIDVSEYAEGWHLLEASA